MGFVHFDGFLVLIDVNNEAILLEYVIYFGTLIISLSFRLRWSMTWYQKPVKQEVTGSNLNHPSYKVEYMRRVCVASTLYVRGCGRVYNISWSLNVTFGKLIIFRIGNLK